MAALFSSRRGTLCSFILPERGGINEYEMTVMRLKMSVKAASLCFTYSDDNNDIYCERESRVLDHIWKGNLRKGKSVELSLQLVI